MRLLTSSVILQVCVSASKIEGWNKGKAMHWGTRRKLKMKMRMSKKVTHRSDNLPEYEADENKVTILRWWADGDQGKLERVDEECGGCWYAHNRSYEHTADAIIFDNTRHAPAKQGLILPLPDMNPRKRNTETQYWVWWPREAASKGFGKVSNYNDIADWDSAFNLTASYRRDSDVTRRWGDKDEILGIVRSRGHGVGHHYQPADKHMKNLMMHKKQHGNHTTWFVSNCDNTNGANARWEYAQRLLQAGLKLDGYGECFHNRLRGATAPWGSDGVISKYKFYLAFENSIHCNDYISEKFWRNGLGSNVVPVVFGPFKKDVSDIAPKKSFIHAEDFSSPKALVDYLDYLNSNDTAYLEYHEWRKDTPKPGTGKEKTARLMCDLCKEVKARKEAGYPKRTISSVSSYWWMNVHDEKCTSGQKTPEWLKKFKPVKMEDTYDEFRDIRAKFIDEKAIKHKRRK